MKLFTFAILITTVFALVVNVQAAAPANNNYANPQALSGASGTTTGTTVDATRDQGEPTHTADNSDVTVYRTVWFEWTAAESKPTFFGVTENAFDGAIAVYELDAVSPSACMPTRTRLAALLT